MNPVRHDSLQLTTRRTFLNGAGQFSLGAIALQALQGKGSAMPPADNPMAPRVTPQAAKAKRVIYLHMSGAPPHLDLFDYKPELVKHDGQDCPDSILKGRTFAFTTGVPKLMGTPRSFKQYGKAGMWMSDACPNFHTIADEITMVRSMHTDQFNHAPAELLLFTGHTRQGRPSLGSWATYGLGTENQDLPGFVTLISSGTQPSGGQGLWGSGFIPSVYQGVQCRSKGDPVLYASDPAGMDRNMRRRTLDALRTLNEQQAAELGHPETITRIAQYELAYRMQMSVPEVMDISKEPASVIEDYGAKPGEASFANNCLLARRLVEKGVRFVQLFDWGWDFHGTSEATGITDGLTKKMSETDRPVAALIKDLKQRGLLEDTLIIWGGEFGRTPFREGRTAASKVLGRDHYPDCFTLFMAGGGVKSGFDYGSTDDLGFSIAENKVHVHDFQATVMHLLGFDHERFTYRFQGRNYRLTDVHGHVVKELLA
ncbi:DUF1501 domain-containing protein [Prosthecobacter sp. SYSU 5D2]|uniref:DUF1501 domain-containing protein n=1 Tax=Prosthecobacter sp. SYSU 5D2 TaxID=3134134 RepID=UPI0031FEE2A1